jgi:tRNA(fMet)-specific endonuclease VapC
MASLQRHDRLEQFSSMIDTAEILFMDLAIAKLAGRIEADLQRTGQPIGIADTIIAATAIAHDLVLVTGNQAHYQRLPPLGYNLHLDNWRT